MSLKRNRARLGMASAVVAPALALAGCGTTVIDSGKAEKLVRQSVAAAGNFKVKSVSCPTNVTPKAGGSFNCQLTVTSNADGTSQSGTVTIHETDANGHVTIDSNDFHLQ
jgi:VCBS repeat-containing protein